MATALIIRFLKPMKTVVIKVIKRKALADIARVLPGKRLRLRPITATTTVNDWIAESRKNKLDGDNASRETLAGWTAAAGI